MIKQIKDNIWKVNNDSNIYVVKDDKVVVIDAGDMQYREQVKKDVSEVVDPKEVDVVIFTHLHYDHIGNYNLFPNAKFYASEESIEDLKRNREGTILNMLMASMFKAKLNSVSSLSIDKFKIINTPGHTRGSICLLYGDVLFSGDTIFDNAWGRDDLPTSVPEKMQESVDKLKEFKYEILAPGHDY
ncbi:MBL fold metallo-hydrolase [Candidatus Woesearchaeota archaeon]|jgi:hydroxyacylglutathione hydrolase|nr:MBL fold metallo-hydrolase [Candidatus Woesearchaeota archaeon]MBT3538065.1 MBL fold metallo-hydrolase [Candidatus Woesearchaeota archaeon]MBT4697149.1 MBL fold metallo-hydrolase [Candidatus Woesearchaeota archaeon]MBT4717140.1 MBL fold metallo-hydrolase [Candidatus Woesearchaeota archaeon]MBT7105734.1 MBL fold metallo-hydrolase [Candidatus Woesearchaeota archaeon]